MEKNVPYVHFFVGSFLTSTVMNVQAMRSTLKNVWQPIGSVSILDLGEGRFMFRFYLDVDVERIERDGPWTFNSHLLILHGLREAENPMGVELFWIDSWVLVHDNPFGFMSVSVARHLGNFIEGFIDYDATAIQPGSKRVM